MDCVFILLGRGNFQISPIQYFSHLLNIQQALSISLSLTPSWLYTHDDDDDDGDRVKWAAESILQPFPRSIQYFHLLFTDRYEQWHHDIN